MRKDDTGRKLKTDTQAAVRALIAAAIDERNRQILTTFPPPPPSQKRSR